MDAPIIVMDRAEAKEAYVEYRDAVRQRHDDELEQVMKGYRAMSKGLGVLDVHEAIKQAGADEHGRPRLAICRAHADECWYVIRTDGSVTFAEERWPGARARFSVRNFPAGTLPEREEIHWRLQHARAIVPMVPPRFLPKWGLHNYHLLWEAEWQPEPPIDPILLKHLGGTLYAVLGQWDLTPLEQAVLKGRITGA